MQPNKFGNGEWIPPGQSIQVAGETIHDGMIYVGTSLSVHGGSVDPCLIDISKQVSAQGEFTKKRVGNFPSYSDISKEARRVYLNWLARGRSDPKIDSGYVLLFLYGLERRVIFDSTKDSCVDLEWRTIAQEIDRLLRIYGQKSGMFASSAVQLWDWVSLTRTLPSRLYNEPLPTLPCTFELSLYFQIALGQAARDNAPISKELALAWVKKDRRFKVVIPDTRYEEQFDSLFIPNYSGKFGEGMMLNKGKSGLEYVYTPSCVDWRYIKITKRSFDDIPTVIRSTIAYKKLNEIVDLTRAGLSLLIEENKRRDKPFSTATVSSVSQNRRVVLLDGTCFQHPEYQKLSPKMRGVGPISDMRNLVQALSNDAPADYGVCVLMDSETAPLLIHRDTRGVETDSISKMMRLLGWNVRKVPAGAVGAAISTISAQAAHLGKVVDIFTDKICMTQYVNNHISTIDVFTGERRDLVRTTAEFGVSPYQLPDLWALMGKGEKSIPSTEKVGTRTAAKLMRKFGSLKQLIEHADRIEGEIGKKIRRSISRLENTSRNAATEINLNLSRYKFETETLSSLLFKEPNPYLLATFYSEFKMNHYAICLALDYFESWTARQLSDPFRIKNGKLSSQSKFVVYRIKNSISNRIYFGSTSEVNTRWASHRREIKSGFHSNLFIANDIRVFGVDCFEFRILSRHPSKAEMLAREQLYISMFYGRNCYNYARFVEMEDGLPSSIFIYAQRERNRQSSARKETLEGGAGNGKSWANFLSIHAAAKGLGISKNGIKAALLGDSPIVSGWILSAQVMLHPNSIGSKSHGWRRPNRASQVL